MRRALGFCLFVVFSTTLFTEGLTRVLFVHADGSGPYIHIQAAIDSSAAGDTVVAMAGTFTGDGNRNIDFLGKAIVVMAESSYDTTVTDSSVIDCEYTGRAFHFHSNEDSLSVLEGFIIRRCDVYDLWPADDGGGILCEEASPKILKNIIRECWASTGAAMRCVGSSAMIIGNRMYDCESMGTPGISCEGGAPFIAMNRIHNNYGASGGGIRCEACTPYLVGNEIYCNDSHYGTGGAEFIGCVSLRMEHNYLYGNSGWSNYVQSPSAGMTPRRSLVQKPLFVNPGGIWLSQSDGVIENNRIIRNVGELYIDGCTLTIRNNQILSNAGDIGAIYCSGSAVTIENNAISAGGGSGFRCGLGITLTASLQSFILNNTITDGDSDAWDLGAIQYDGSSESVIAGNVISGHYYASGIRCRSSIRIVNNVIHSNVGSRTGGGIYCEASPIIEGNTIVGNSSGQGAGIYCAEGSSPVIRNNIIANNNRDYRTEGGEGIYAASASIVVECNDVFANEGGNYAGIPDQTGVNGNISQNPFFCDAAAHDYSIHEMSPCAPGNHPGGDVCGLIGARGIGCYYIATLVKSYRTRIEPPAIVVSWELAGVEDDPRFVVSRAEMPEGMYRQMDGIDIIRAATSFSFKDDRCEPGSSYRYRVDAVDEGGRRMLFETDVVTAPAAPLALRQNHPNPFNPSTAIEYYLPEKAGVRLEIFDVAGRRIAALQNGEQERGAHVAVWNGNDGRGAPVASGVYVCRLTAGKESLTRKMILLR